MNFNLNANLPAMPLYWYHNAESQNLINMYVLIQQSLSIGTEIKNQGSTELKKYPTAI